MSRAAQQRAAIRRLTAALAASAPADVVQQLVVEEARRLTDAASAALCLLVEGGDMLDFVAAAGEHTEQIVGMRIRVADSLSEAVVATRQPVLIDARTSIETGDLFAAAAEFAPDAVPIVATTAASAPAPAAPPGHAREGGGNPPQGDQAKTEGPLSTRSAAVVPLIQDGRLIGTLSALNKGEGSELTPLPAFDAEDLDTLTLL